MSQRHDGPIYPFTASAAITSKYRFLALDPSSGNRYVTLAGAGDEPVAVNRELAAAAGDKFGGYLLNKEGTLQVKISGAVTVGDKLYTAADGKASATPSTFKPAGVAMQSGVDGDVIEFLPFDPESILSGQNVAELVDEFNAFTDTQLFTVAAADSGSAAVGDAKGGVLTISPSDGTAADNDHTQVATTNEIAALVDGKPLLLEAWIEQDEANTDDANWFVGLSDDVAADFLLDDGAGPKTTFDGFGFFKVDGETKIRAVSSNGTAQTVQTAAESSVSTSGSQRKLQVLAIPSGTSATLYFYVDGTLLATHTLSLTSLGEMHVLFAAKNGSANHDTLLVDFVKLAQVR